MDSTPLTVFTCPSSPSSPRISMFFILSVGITPMDASIPAAMGRSKAVPSFLISAGKRLIVILFGGMLKPELRSAVRTRSPASFTQEDRYPTIFITGSPSCISVSTDMSVPSIPCTSPLNTLLYISKCSFPLCRAASPSEHILH